MLNAINTKVLIGILAALLTIAGVLVHQRQVDERAAAAAAQAAAILRQQQLTEQQQREHDAAVSAEVERKKKLHNSAPANGSKTWKTYVP